MLLRFVLISLLMALPAVGELWSKGALQAAEAQAILDAWNPGQEVPRSVPQVVLWTPSDREPAVDYRSRLTGLLHRAADCLNLGIANYGFQGRAVGYDEDGEGAIRIHLARGKRKMADYSVQSIAEIREDCFRILREAGINPRNETVFVFCNSAIWNEENSSYSEMASFPSNGNHQSGVAWLVDSPILNVAYLSEEGPDINHFALGKITFRDYNRHMLHRSLREMGRSMGLPLHEGGLPIEPGGIASFMDERNDPAVGEWDQAPGVALADALRLITHPVFSGASKGVPKSFDGKVFDLDALPSDRGFLLKGRVESKTPPYALIGYLSSNGGEGEVIRRSTVAIPSWNGTFALEFEGMVPGESAEIELVVLQCNGAASDFQGGDRQEIPCQIGFDGEVDLSLTRAVIVLVPFAKALWQSDRATVNQMIRDTRISADPNLQEIADRWVHGKSRRVAQRDSATDFVALSDLEPKQAETGYGPALHDRLPGPQPLLLSGKQLFNHGLYAHAPAKYRWDLDRPWTTLSGSAGLADGHPGSVVFEIRGDGKLLWKSPVVLGGQLREFKVTVDGVAELEFLTHDAGDGKSDDWALWLEPRLER